MKRYKKRILICLMVLIAVVLCLVLTLVLRREKIDCNSYIEGKDHQYMFYNEAGMCTVQARGNKGTFLSIKNYIYFIEDGTKEAVPLCNKVDCLHDKETEENKKKQCNAYMEAFLMEVDPINIAYNDGYVYYIDQLSDELYGKQVLYRLSEDGSQKEKIYEWENPEVQCWCLHRDVLYYVNVAYALPDGENADSANVYSLKKLELNCFLKKPKDIYSGDEQLNIYSVGYLKAYGNYVYFRVYGNTAEDESLLTEENAHMYVYNEMIVYDIINENYYELDLMDNERNEEASLVTFYNDRLIISSYSKDDNSDLANIYIADLDGKNQEILWKDIQASTRIHSDGKYLYTSNAVRIMNGKDELPVVLNVYNKEFEMTDTFSFPWFYWGQIGASDYLYIYINSDNKQNLEVVRFDKSEIGFLNGKEIEYQKVLEIPLDK